MAPLKSFEELKAKYDSFMRAQNEITKDIKTDQSSTDIYIERYLPIATLNLIRDVTEDGFGRKSDRRQFRQALKDKFQWYKNNLAKLEKLDGAGQHDKVCRLKKNTYEIPKIDVDSDSEDSSSQEEESDQQDLDFSRASESAVDVGSNHVGKQPSVGINSPRDYSGTQNMVQLYQINEDVVMENNEHDLLADDKQRIMKEI